MSRKTYAEMTPEQQAAYRRRSIESNARNQKQIPLKYKKEIAEKLYLHAEQMGDKPITWIKKAIAERYFAETGQPLDE